MRGADPMYSPPAHFPYPEMFSRSGDKAVCMICGTPFPLGEEASVMGDLHWAFHNELEDRLRKLEGRENGQGV